MNGKFKEKYISEFYRNNLLDELHNLFWVLCLFRITTIFDDSTIRCDMREDHYQTISRCCSDLISDIRRAMLTSSYHVDSVEEGLVSFRDIIVFQRDIYFQNQETVF